MLIQRLWSARYSRTLLNLRRCCSTANAKPSSRLVPLSSLKPDELGHSILFCKQTLPPGSPRTPHDMVATNAKPSSRLVPLSSLKPDELGHSILFCKQTLPPGSPRTPHDMVASGVFIAKVLSLSSSAVGAVMVPVLTSYLWEAATERPSMMMFTVVANTFLVLLSFTPLLLHFLAKRFPINLYYNHDTKTFTSVHYNFFLRKMALRFQAHEVVDAQIAPEMRKVWIPLATAFVRKRPLLISLDRKASIALEKSVTSLLNNNVILNIWKAPRANDLEVVGLRIITNAKPSSRLVPLSSLKPDELGHSILFCKQTLPPGSPRTPHDMVASGVFIAKVLSLSSSAVGAVMVPVLTSYLWEAATERPSMMMFTVVANTFLVLLSFTPLLLHFLAKRFPINLYYNHDTKVWIPLATAFVRKRPLLISLDRKAYVDKLAFDEMTKNIEIPANHD
ncbi:hypothetical protein COOONC_04501 [Cooperia oncophora]